MSDGSGAFRPWRVRFEDGRIVELFTERAARLAVAIALRNGRARTAVEHLDDDGAGWHPCPGAERLHDAERLALADAPSDAVRELYEAAKKRNRLARYELAGRHSLPGRPPDPAVGDDG